MGLPARDEVEPLVELREQSRDLGRVILEVGVDRDEDLAFGVCEPGRERCRLAEVPPQTDDPDVVVGVVQTGERRERAVGRAVVDEHHFPGLVQRLECGVELLIEERHRPLLVMNRDDDRDHGG